jgi:fructosamine-3-kinase
LGKGLARLHLATAEQFGFDHDNYIGLTPQSNGWTRDGHEFFGRQRLGYQGDLAVRRNLLSSGERARLERLIDRLPELTPSQPASLIHGDLWGGNLIAGPGGEPALIDPAAHYGWAEADLAMTALFGGFDPAVYAAYQDCRPLAPGWRERFEIYNLYHLLNHLNLFGGGYHAGVMAVLRRYA